MYSPAGAPGCQCERRARQREGRSSRPAARSMLELDDPPGRGQLRVGEQVPDLDDRPARHAMGVQQHQQSSARASLARSTSPTSASCWIRRGLAAKRTWVATARVNQPSGAGKGRRTERTPATTARARRIREPPRLPNTTGGAASGSFHGPCRTPTISLVRAECNASGARDAQRGGLPRAPDATWRFLPALNFRPKRRD